MLETSHPSAAADNAQQLAEACKDYRRLQDLRYEPISPADDGQEWEKMRELCMEKTYERILRVFGKEFARHGSSATDATHLWFQTMKTFHIIVGEEFAVRTIAKLNLLFSSPPGGEKQTSNRHGAWIDPSFQKTTADGSSTHLGTLSIRRSRHHDAQRKRAMKEAGAQTEHASEARA